VKKAIFFTLAWVLLSFSTATAEIPKLINYQGMLTNDGGNPLTGSYDLTFYIYDDTTGGDLKWSETQNGVQVQNGLFNVVLGKNSELNLAFDQSYWLAVKVGTETLPRIRFTSVGYAYRARMADTASVAVAAPSTGGWTDDGSVVRLTTSIDKVGIGTSTPGAELEVFSPDQVDLWLNRGGMAWAAALNFRRGGGLDWSILTPSGDTSLLILNRNYQTVQSFLQGGNVGIGKTNPSSKLDVDGDINTSSSYKIFGSKVLSAPNQNLFVGLAAGYSNTTGGHNTIVGTNAGDNNTTGSYNIFLGPYAGRFNTSGSHNIVIGESGSYWDSSGNCNTIIGTRAGHNNDTGSYNVFLGYEAGYNEAGSNKLYIANSETSPPLIYGDFSTGSVGVGTTNPGQKLDVDLGNMVVQGTGSFDANGEEGVVYLGSVHHYIKGVYGFGVKIGTYAAGDVVSIKEISGNVGIGTTDPQGFRLAVSGDAAKSSGGTSWATFSDARLKDMSGLYECGLSEIGKLEPVRFRYKQDNQLGLPTKQEQVGLVAQDVKDVIPDAVSENDQGYLMLNSDPIIWAMLNAIKELKAENDELKKRIERLETE
jgi:hypothetical protein